MPRIFSFFIISQIFISCSKNSNNAFTHLKEGDKIEIYNTSRFSSDRISKIEPVEFRPFNSVREKENTILVNPGKQHQEFIGIGATISDASSEVFSSLSSGVQSEFLKACFNNDSGIGLNLIKTTIHSSEFSPDSYTYIKSMDSLLNTFSIQRDLAHRIPLIKSILSENNEVKVLATPYSPPAFMKNNNSMYGGGKLKKEFYHSWADYFIKYLDSYYDNGIEIRFITLQNEPLSIKKSESCIFEAREELDFLTNHLGPKLNSSKNKGVKVLVWNDSETLIMHGANTIFQNESGNEYATGIAYNSNISDRDNNLRYGNLDELRDCYPQKNIINTNFSISDFDSAKIDSWSNAELFGEALIQNFMHGAGGFITSNILLNMEGGPNHTGGAGYALIHSDTKNSKFLITPSYYYIGHFSRFISPGAKKISSTSSGVKSISFINPDKSIRVIVLNNQNIDKSYRLVVGDVEARIDINAKSIQTLIF